MPEYLAPGVFVEEIDGGSKPIEGVGTNTAAFIGYAKSGEFNKPLFISNWSQFCAAFGEEENALVVALCDELGMDASDLMVAKKASRKGWTDYAQAAIADSVRAGDLGPEGLAFIPAIDSPTGEPLLVVANEISGSTSIFRVVQNGDAN